MSKWCVVICLLDQASMDVSRVKVSSVIHRNQHQLLLVFLMIFMVNCMFCSTPLLSEWVDDHPTSVIKETHGNKVTEWSMTIVQV